MFACRRTMSVLVDHIPPYGGDVLRRRACGTICTRACWLGSSGSRKHSLCANHDHDLVLPISRELHRELKRKRTILRLSTGTTLMC